MNILYGMTDAILQKELLNSRPKSQAVYERLLRHIPGGANSPVRSFCSIGKNNVTPFIADRGEGSSIYDVDGNRYIDYCMSWGPLIHGHCHPEILQAAIARMQKGTTFGISTEVEAEIAELVKRHVPSIEKIRFVSSGTEATMSASRLARGYTKRNLVVKFAGNYHGHADQYLVQAGSGVMGLTKTSTSLGIPQDTIKHTVCLSYNDVEGVEKFLLDPANKDQVACVILEPIAGNIGCVPATAQFLQMLSKVTRQIGALLIFDEVITGFRVALGGAQALYGIKPDLTCFGKIIGGGFAAAAFGGRSEVMDHLAPLGAVYQAGTLSGNPVAMEAGKKSIELASQPGFYEELNRKANLLLDPVRELINSKGINACVQQVGSMFTLFFGQTSVTSMEQASRLDAAKFSKYFEYMFNHGVYLPPAAQECAFVSSAHSDEELLHTSELISAFLLE